MSIKTNEEGETQDWIAIDFNVLVYNVRSTLGQHQRMQFSTAIQITNLYSVIGLTETWLTKCIGSADILSLNHKICQKRLTIKKGSRQTLRNSHCSCRKCSQLWIVVWFTRLRNCSSLDQDSFARMLYVHSYSNAPMYAPTQTQNEFCWEQHLLVFLLSFHKQRQKECKISELLIVSDTNFDQTLEINDFKRSFRTNVSRWNFVRIPEHNLLKVTQVGLFLPCRLIWKQFHWSTDE